MIADSARLVLSGNIESLAARVVTWREFRTVHSVTLSAEELREIAEEILTLGCFFFRGATVSVASKPAPLVSMRLATEGE